MGWQGLHPNIQNLKFQIRKVSCSCACFGPLLKPASYFHICQTLAKSNHCLTCEDGAARVAEPLRGVGRAGRSWGPKGVVRPWASVCMWTTTVCFPAEGDSKAGFQAAPCGGSSSGLSLSVCFPASLPLFPGLWMLCLV